MHPPIPTGTLVVVADGATARAFTNVGGERRLALREDGQLQVQDLVDGLQASAESVDEAIFARQLAGQLNEDALGNRYAHLVLVADPQTLGRIRPLLHKLARQRLVMDLAKDLTHAAVAEIERALTS